MDLKEAILRRRTANNAFEKKEISIEVIRDLILSANRAPSHFNSQPWDFILITDQELRNTIGDIAKDSMKKLMEKGNFFSRYKKYFRFNSTETKSTKSGIHIDKLPFFLKPFVSFIFGDEGVKIMNFLNVPEILSRDAKKIVSEAPLLLGFMLKKEEYVQNEKSGIYTLISMGAALQNLWLTATSHGIGLQFVSTPMEIPENWEKIKSMLKVPDTHELMAIYRLGYINQNGERNTIDWSSDHRRDFEDLVSWNFYKTKNQS
ncbi:MAG: nitroreductase family protein [Leptospiraceae bacterium]|nr:nitroreductase family protein [Leptospiraceae bacterium]